MDVFLKRYFWVFTLLVIALCAIFLGRTGSRFIEQLWLSPDDIQPAARRPGFGPPERTRTKEIDKIVERNVFCSFCAPIKLGPDHPGPDAPTDNTPRKTELQLELVSTMVVPADEEWSMAVIRDVGSKEKDPGLYRKGSLLPGGAARVARVIERKVYLDNNGRLEYLDIEGAGQAAQPTAVASLAPTPMASGDPLDNDINRGVRCSGSNCEIDRPLIDKLLANTTLLATSARFVPSIRDGKPNGFKLYAIRPNSIFGKIGLQNGDTVKVINGMEMSSPDQALGVYTKVRNASHLTVGVDRRGENVTLDYTIR